MGADMREDLAKLLTELSIAERTELATHLEYVRTHKAVANFSFDAERWWEAAKGVLKEYNLTTTVDHLEGYLRTHHIGREAYKKTVEMHQQLFIDGGLDFHRASADQQSTMYRMSIGCLAMWKLRMYSEQFITADALIKFGDNTKIAFDLYFPGYVENKSLWRMQTFSAFPRLP
jgi:hypothetical protein